MIRVTRSKNALTVLVAFFIGVSGTAAWAKNHAAGARSAPADVFALSVLEAPTPRLQVPHYRTSGTFPQVAGRNVDLRAVNTALRQAVADEQHQYARVALRAEARIPKAVQRKYPGVYKTRPQTKLISASSRVVSALIPLVELLPGGTDGATWLSMTVRVPSGSRIKISDLFTHRLQGLQALATAAETRVRSKNGCVQEALNDPVAGRAFARGFGPTPMHYEHFALTATGLAVGFENGQIAYPRCGRVVAMIPYARLRPHVNRLGAELIAGVRTPR